MIYLGISEDLFDAGVTICDAERVLFASNEERYTRRKDEGGFPARALESAFASTGIGPAEVDEILYSGIATPPVVVRAFPGLHTWLFEAKRQREDSAFKRLLDAAVFGTPASHATADSLSRKISKPLLPFFARRMLPGPLQDKPKTFVEHHQAHAAGAWSLSGLPRALCITADGMGDGLSMTVSRCEEGHEIARLWSAPARSSFGLFFEMLTEALGFMSCRDEGKLTGLAAYGDPGKISLPSPFSMKNGRLAYAGPFGRRGVEWVRRELLPQYSREDVCAWAQYVLETHVTDITRHWLRQTGLSALVIAGGVFANVKLNQRLHEVDEVERLFVYPNMGDGGLSLGAIRAVHPAPLQPVQDVFYGEAYSEAQIEGALRGAGVHYETVDEPERVVAELLAQGKIVARFQGRMEWGPRALGNRSILVRTSERTVVSRLNTLLDRSDFMPFAPALLDEDAGEWLVDYAAARHTAAFMTACFKCTERMKREHPAVVHVDGTARAQLVEETANPGFHKILDEFKHRTGSSVLLNTSFNIHEEPIVRTPEEAISTFVRAWLDYLSIGSFLVENVPAHPAAPRGM